MNAPTKRNYKNKNTNTKKKSGPALPPRPTKLPQVINSVPPPLTKRTKPKPRSLGTSCERKLNNLEKDHRELEKEHKELDKDYKKLDKDYKMSEDLNDKCEKAYKILEKEHKELENKFKESEEANVKCLRLVDLIENKRKKTKK